MPDYPNNISSKLPKVGTTIFTVMSKLAEANQAINLSQGFPNFQCSEKLLSLVNHYMQKGFNQYAPMPGIMPLREILAQKTQKLYNAVYDPETEITITAGATQAIYTAISAIIREGDEVVLFTPAYDCYQPAIELNGGKPVFVKLKAPDYAVNWDSVKKLINQRTKMIIINTPHNPTGMVFSASDMEQLQSIVKNSNIIILSDEVYEHIIFDDRVHQSVCKYPALAERSFVISSFGKTFHTTGWKMGYVLAPKTLMEEFRKIHQYLVFSCNTPIQYALAEFLKNDAEYLGLSAFYQQKRDFFLKLIKASRFEFTPSPGTYFQLLNYKNISEEKDTDFAISLTNNHKIASVPISVFYNTSIDNKMLRFCFAKDDETLEKAAEILCNI
jgi:methionine transaminase